MLELPRHHLPRPSLVSSTRDATVVIVEAASGFGKSTFAAELSQDGRTAAVRLAADVTGHRGLLLPLRRALRRVGEADAAVALGELTSDGADALEAMSDALEQVGALTLVLDDVHHLGAHAGLLLHLVQHQPPAVRLVISARALPATAERLRTLPGVVHVGTEQLRFTPTEVADVLRRGFEVPVDDVAAAQVAQTTGGWPAAVAFVGEQLRRHPDRALDADVASDFSSHVLRLVPAHLRDAAIQLAHLPRVDPELAEAATGVPDVLRDAGLPYLIDSAGGHRLPGVFADALARRARLDPAVAMRVAGCHLTRAEPFEALSVLRRARAWDDLAETLVRLPIAARPHLTADEITSVIDALPERTVRANPWVLIELARALSRAGVRDTHHDALDRADRLAGTQSAAFRRAIEGQRVADALFVDDREAVTDRARAVVEDAGVGEEATIARGLVVLGTLHAWDAQRSEARRALRRAARMFVELGEPFEAARALVQLGFNVDLHDDLRVAERTFDEAVRLAAGDSRSRATALTYRGEAKAWLGRFAEGEQDLDAALDLARAARDSRAHAYATWGLALLASLRGDPVRTVALVEETERRLRSWSDTGVGATFVATMTDLLDRAGADGQADAMLARAVARRQEQPELVALAEFVVAARRGDPAEVERLWPAIEADDGLEPFERVRCRFLRAYAAWRASDPALAQRYEEALAHAETIGLPQLPAVLEPVAAAALAGWAAQASGGWVVHCFGRLRVTRGGETVTLPPGRPTMLVGWLALAGEPRRVARLVEVLWPDATETSARTRLRQVLYRLRQAAPDLVVRLPGDRLALGPEVTTDLATVEVDLTTALAGGPDAAAAADRVAARTRLPLLSDLDVNDPDRVREIRRAAILNRCKVMADRMAAAADGAGDAALALRWAWYAHELDPLDDHAALALARRLVEGGRPADARQVLADTAARLRQAGIDAPPALETARRRLGLAGS